MTLSEKIADERKKKGWSQEDLSEKLDVSRQSISKWESGQCAPDLPKIIAMSDLFGVSTDYLLKEDAGKETKEPAKEPSSDPVGDEPTSRRRFVSNEEAGRFLAFRNASALPIAVGVLLCILSPILLIVLAGLSEAEKIAEGLAVTLGLCALFVFVAVAVLLFVISDLKGKEFDYFDREKIECSPGLRAEVKEKKKAFFSAFTAMFAVGVLLCVLCPLPLILTMNANAADWIVCATVGVLLGIVAIGVFLIVFSTRRMSGFDALLEEGDYSQGEKMSRKRLESIESIFWSAVLAIYLLWSFLTKSWHISWIVWPIAAVVNGMISTYFKFRYHLKDEDEQTEK